MDEAGVDRMVIVPPSWPGDRNDYALEAATALSRPLRHHGPHSAADPKSAALLPKWKEQPGMKGIRLTFMREQAALLDQRQRRLGLARRREGRAAGDVLCARTTFRSLRRHRRAPSGLPLIIDHMSLTAEIAKEGRIARAIDEVVKLAKYPNVSVKLSSAPNFSQEAYPFRDMTEHIKRCFDAFGPRRCYWGTDLTNSMPKATYRQRITHFTEHLPFLSEEDKDWVMGKAILARSELGVARGCRVRRDLSAQFRCGGCARRAAR